MVSVQEAIQSSAASELSVSLLALILSYFLCLSFSLSRWPLHMNALNSAIPTAEEAAAPDFVMPLSLMHFLYSSSKMEHSVVAFEGLQ